MEKFYISSMEDLNDYERQHNKISYATLCNRAFGSMILCNEIVNVDNEIFDNIENGDIDYNSEIYQYYLVTLNADIDFIKEHYGDELILAYSNVLDLYVLLVDHYGTSWDYVLTNIEPTTNFEEAISD